MDEHKKKLSLFLFFVIVSVVIFWKYRTRHRPDTVTMPITYTENTKPAPVADESALYQEDSRIKTIATAIANDPTGNDGEGLLPTEPGVKYLFSEKECIKKIEEQSSYQEYLNYNLNFWTNDFGDWYFATNSSGSNQTPATRAGQFMLALAKAGLLIGTHPPVKENFDDALIELGEVSQRDPLNSAPLIFMAIIEEKRGNSQQANLIFEKTKRTTKFDSYVTSVVYSVFKNVRTPADIFAGYAIWAELPIPDYKSLITFLTNRDSKQISEQMIQQTLNDSNIFPDLDFFILDYGVGHTLLNKTNSKNTIPSVQEIIAKKNSLRPHPSKKILAALRRECNLNVYTDELQILQKYFQTHPLSPSEI